MFRVILIDDNPIILKEFKNIITSIGVEEKIPLDILTFLDGNELLSYIDENHNNVDLICLDLMMEPLSGAEIAKQIRERGILCEIVFLTSSDEYRFQFAGKEFFSYVLKGKTSKDELRKIILDVKERKFIPKEKDALYIIENGSNVRVDIDEIVFFERVDAENILISCKDKIHPFHRSYEAIAKDFKERNFVNIDNKYLVHLANIKKFDKDKIVLSNDKIINTSIEKIKEAKILLAQYLINS